MIYNLSVNQKMCEDEKLSYNAVLIFGVFKQLMNLTYVHKKIVGEDTYFILNKSYILEQIPYAPIKARTLTSTIKELIDSGFLLSDGGKRNPAYAFTSKADKYISSIVRDGEENISPKKRKPLFELQKLTSVVDLDPSYYSLLKEHCLESAKKKGVPAEEFDNFIAHHGSKGTKFKNYIMAFATWCAKYNKYNSANGADSSRGLYG